MREAELQWGRAQLSAEIARFHLTSFQRARARFASGMAAATGTIQHFFLHCFPTACMNVSYALRAAPGDSSSLRRSRPLTGVPPALREPWYRRPDGILTPIWAVRNQFPASEESPLRGPRARGGAPSRNR